MIAATGQNIFFKLDSFFFRRMTLKLDGIIQAPPLCYFKLCPLFQSHKVSVPVTAAWSQFHASLVRQWSCLLVWGMSPFSLPAECSLFTNLHNFGKKLRTNTAEVLIPDTFFQILRLCRWILISYIIIKCDWLDSGQSPLISYENVQKRPIGAIIGNSWFPVTLKFDRWPWKTMEHIFCATSSFVHHFTTISQFKL